MVNVRHPLHAAGHGAFERVWQKRETKCSDGKEGTNTGAYTRADRPTVSHNVWRTSEEKNAQRTGERALLTRLFSGRSFLPLFEKMANIWLTEGKLHPLYGSLDKDFAKTGRRDGSTVRKKHR